MASGTVHIVGAGLAGLSAAVSCVGIGREIVVHELARHAGGRCRSYFEPALGLTIDNGNHLLLSANDAALAFLKTIGSEGKLAGPDEAEIRLRRSCRRASVGCCIRTRVRCRGGSSPRTAACRAREPLDYLSMMRLLMPGRDESIDKIIDCSGILYERLSRPLFLAALNTEPREASAFLAGAILRETLGARRPRLPSADRLGGARSRLHRPGARLSRAQRRQAPLHAPASPASEVADGKVKRSISARTRSSLPPAMPSFSPCPPRSRGCSCPTLTLRRHSAPSSTRISRSRRPKASRACSASSTARPNGCSPIPTGFPRPSAPRTASIETVARGARASDLEGCGQAHRRERRHAAMAHRQGAPRHLRRAARGECQAAASRDAARQSLSRRRLDRDRTSGNHRRGHSLRQDGREFDAGAKRRHA